MRRIISRLQTPVKRQGAEDYLLITLLSFAASVIVTRSFLNLTGFPQLGGGGLHIAHVLWGGLFLFVGALFPLLLANRWAFTISAVAVGIGIGLFIDEVGKFITSNNDYFYPAAAPIIYMFFLLTVILYLRVCRPPSQNPRAELYLMLDELQEVLDHDLDASERAEIETQLKYILAHTDDADLSRLAKALLEFITHEGLHLVSDQTPLSRRIVAVLSLVEKRWINRRRLRWALVVCLGVLGVLAFTRLGTLLFTGVTGMTFEQTLMRMAAQTDLKNNPGSPGWFLARIILEGVTGLMLLMGSALLGLRSERRGLALGYYGLLLSLGAVNLLVFYYDQFSTIAGAIIQFIVLMGVVYYRRTMGVQPKCPPPNLNP